MRSGPTCKSLAACGRNDECPASTDARGNMIKVLSRSVVALALLTAACTQSQPTTIVQPTPSTPPITVEAFSGTLQPQGTTLHTFNVAQTGYVEVTLIGIAPQLVAGPAAPVT